MFLIKAVALAGADTCTVTEISSPSGKMALEVEPGPRCENTADLRGRDTPLQAFDTADKRLVTRASPASSWMSAFMNGSDKCGKDLLQRG